MHLRHFLYLAIAYFTVELSKSENLDETIDVVVVGAGISGSYCAWKLSEKHPDWKIQIFDAMDRVGGRLHSIELDGFPGRKVDLGGMRFRKKRHYLTYQLIKELGLESRVIKFTTPTKKESMYYFRDKPLTNDDIEMGMVPFNLTNEERKLSADSTQLLKFWNKKITGKEGVDPWNKGVMNAYSEVTSFDAITYLAYRDLHNSAYFSNENFQKFVDDPQFDDHHDNDVKHFYPFMLYSKENTKELEMTDDTQMFTLDTGFQEMVIQMINKFQQGPNPFRRHVFLAKKLTELYYTDDDVAVLTFYDQKDATQSVVRARKVILALPSEALSKIQFRNNGLFKAIGGLVPTVIESPAMKTFLVFDNPWWLDYLRRKHGSDNDLRVIGTDLPIGTILDYGYDNKTGKAILLFYSEWYNNRQYWEAIDTNFNSAEMKQTQVSAYHLELIYQFLYQIFDVNYLPNGQIPRPIDSVSVVWHTDHIGCAWHFFSAGHHYKQVMDTALKPVNDRELYIVGETFSDVQGWCQGALSTAHNLLNKYFGFDTNCDPPKPKFTKPKFSNLKFANPKLGYL